MSGYYTPSGVPQTNSKAASAAVRTEFQSISTAFSLFPALAGNAGRAFVVNGSGDAVVLTVGQLSLAGNLTTSGALTTTGAFSTVFAQTASVTLTLPSVTSTLATAASVSAETTRALAAEALLAPLASPALTGTPTVPTAAPGNNTTIAASTAFVTAAVVAATTGVASFNARTGAVTLQAADVTGVGGALLASPAFSGNPTAPTPTFGDNDTSIPTTAFVQSAVAPALNNVGRNLLHNSTFLVFARGAGPFTTNGAYTADRWAISLITDTASFNVVALSDANRAAIGDESAKFGISNAFAGSAAAAAYNQIYQRIEDVRRYSNETVTASFWAWAASGTPKIGVSVDQNMGTGGSPSSAVLNAGQAITISTTPARYQARFALGSLSGLTLGTNNDSSTQLNFWYSSGATEATRAGNIGVQSGLIVLWGVQLEIASVATPLEKLDFNLQVAQCQRFYQSLGPLAFAGTAPSAAVITVDSVTLPVLMRTSPTAGFTGSTFTNASAVSSPGSSPTSVGIVVTSSGAGLFLANTTVVLSADL